MPIITIELQLSIEDLLNAVQQLTDPELDLFVSQVIELQEQRQGTNKAKTEVELSTKKTTLNVFTETQKRYAELLAKRQAKTLTPEEYRELIHLTKQVKK